MWFSNRRARLRKQAQSCPPTAGYNAMGLSMAYHPHHHHHVHSAAAVAAAAAHQHSTGGPSYMDHFSNSAALSAAAAASAASGSPPGSGSSSAAYSNQAAVQAAIGSSLQQTTTVSSPSSYSLNPSSGNLGNSNGVGQQHSSSSPTSNISHNHASAALLASQVYKKFQVRHCTL